MYWSKEKMQQHALQYSMGYKAKKGYTFWEKDFDAMARKTMLRQLISKYGIMSTELQNAYESDMAYIKEDGSKVYFDNENETATIDEEETPKVAKSLDEL
jgi:recombination protein RecT